MPSSRPVSEEEIEAYVQRSQHSPCFVCQIVAGTADYQHRIIYEDQNALVFLAMHQIFRGYTLVAPRQHREHVVSDFSLDEYLSLQKLVYSVGQAVQRVVTTERLYVLSFGSQQGNRHVHWHVVPLPPGVPYEKQQSEAIKLNNGVVEMTEDEKAELAAQIGEELRSG